MIGLGSDALRPVPVDAAYQMDLNALSAMIAADKAAGLTPFVIIGTAGSVTVGSNDDLDALADIAAAEGAWFHVDGAFGALAVLSPETAPRVAGITRADSLAFDFHKWLHVTYDAGCVLIRDRGHHLASWSARPDYLTGADRGLAAGNPWFCEFGPELSRGFRALKVWFQLKEHGLARLGEKIAENCRQAARLADLVDDHRSLERMAPVAMNICCLRFVAMDDETSDSVNREIVVRLQEAGIAAPSTVTLNGRLAIRVNITNHRTRMDDLDILTDAIARTGHEILQDAA